MKNIVRRSLVKLIIPLLIFMNCPVYASQEVDAQPPQPTTDVMHKAADQVIAGQRINIYAEIEDSKGIDLVRVYFKAAEGAHYNFVPMTPGEKREKGLFDKFKQLGSHFNGAAYTAILPAPANDSKSIEYLLLIKNGENKVVKTQTYTVSVKDSEDQTEQAEPIKVYTELSEAPTELTGFADNITFDVVESAGKFGVVAGLYSTLTSGGEGAISGGTIAASTGGFTTTATVVAGVTALAVIGGAVAASGGSSGSGGVTGTCDSATQNGGDTPETHKISLGKTSGTFSFSWNNGGAIPDRMVVSVGGNTLFDTGCTAGSSSTSISFSGGSVATVDVQPNCNGNTSNTFWSFRVGCP